MSSPRWRPGEPLRIDTLGADTATPTGKLLLNVLGVAARFERDMMLERQREGIAKVMGEGAYRRRKSSVRRELFNANTGALG